MGEYIMKKEIFVGHHITGQTNMILKKKKVGKVQSKLIQTWPGNPVN